MGGGANILIPVANEKRMPDGEIDGGWCDDYIAPCMDLIGKVKAEEKIFQRLSFSVIPAEQHLSGNFL